MVEKVDPLDMARICVLSKGLETSETSDIL